MRRSGKAHGKVLRLSEPHPPERYSDAVCVCVCVEVLMSTPYVIIMCVCDACHPMRSIERTIPSRRHREVEAGSTGNVQYEWKRLMVWEYCASSILGNNPSIYRFFIHASSRRVFQSRNVKHDKHGNERWSAGYRVFVLSRFPQHFPRISPAFPQSTFSPSAVRSKKC